jgi:large subunit ribosomal protein L21
MATKTRKTDIESNFAVIKTGGKQYVVRVGDIIKIEKLDQTEGKVSFDQVLAVSNGEDLNIGTPNLKSVVEGEIVEVGRDKKITVIKYKAKSNYFKKNGHRQPFAKVKITSIK